MSDLISYQLDDGIATLTLNNGKVNAISPDVIAATRPWIAPSRTRQS
jgi:enoyl-CoA hydratase